MLNMIPEITQDGWITIISIVVILGYSMALGVVLGGGTARDFWALLTECDS